jgi:hypothetical protein
MDFRFIRFLSLFVVFVANCTSKENDKCKFIDKNVHVFSLKNLIKSLNVAGLSVTLSTTTKIMTFMRGERSFSSSKENILCSKFNNLIST